MSELKITVSGEVGSGKSAMLGEIEILCKALGIPVRYKDETAAQAEKHLTHAEWTEELNMYKPSVMLVEEIIRRTQPEATKPAQDLGAAIGNTGNAEADRLINRLMSSDPDFDDCADAAAFIRRMVIENKGPDGFVTWKDAAVAERMKRTSP